MKYILKYSSIIAFIILSFFIEMLGSLFTDGSLFIHDLRFIATEVVIFSAILFIIKNDLIRFYVVTGLLIFKTVVNLFFILLFDMTGQHFVYEMFSLKNDAFGILENIPLNFIYFTLMIFVIIVFYILGKRFITSIKNKQINEPFIKSRKIAIASLIIILGVTANFFTAYSINSGGQMDFYEKLLYDEVFGNYREYGATGNFLNELYGGLFFNEEKSNYTTTEMNDFLYKDVANTSDYFGVSEGNNVVMILGETFEWFTFLKNLDKYPNGHTIEEEQLREIYPNLYRLYDNSVIFDNYHVREKTDLSEHYSLLGAYPNGGYISYDYANNTMPNSIVNVLRELEGLNVANSVHNGTKKFYNRDTVHLQLGFDQFLASTDLERMFPDEFDNYIDEGLRNLDYQMINSSKDILFSETERFFAFAISITQHGNFTYRDNLTEEYKKLKEYYPDIDNKELEKTDNYQFLFHNYLAAGLNMDRAIGAIFDDLEAKNQLENTTIMIYGDHNAYYQGLSSYVKDISLKPSLTQEENYVDLYNVPVMIYDEKVVAEITANGDDRHIEKYTTASDMVMTLYDILGINVFENMYFGSSAFTDDVSLAYSRGYDVFMSEFAYFLSLNQKLFVNNDLSNSEKEKYFEDVVKPAALKLIEKMRYIDYMYSTDYYANKENYDYFYKKLKEIQ